MAAVADARGLKRICAGCGIRFYDMNKRPIICPSCGTEFTGEIKYGPNALVHAISKLKVALYGKGNSRPTVSQVKTLEPT